MAARKRKARALDERIDEAREAGAGDPPPETEDEDQQSESDSGSDEGDESGGVDVAQLDDSESDSELGDEASDDDGEEPFVSALNGHASRGEGSSNDDEEDRDSEAADGEDEEDDAAEDEKPTDGIAARKADNGAVDEDDDNDNDDEDIALSELSDLSSGAKEDLVPHQRVTVNNVAALRKALHAIALPLAALPFSEHQAVTAAAPAAAAVPDVNDDLGRELAFYKQALDAARRARALLRAEPGAPPFSRPPDYFAEMVKSDEHMGRIREKLRDEAAGKKAAAEARRQRDLRKFGKQVQVAKQQERDRQKRETLDRIQLLKKKRKNAPDTGDTREEDMFDVALEEATKPERQRRSSAGVGGGSSGAGRGAPAPSSFSSSNHKRQKRDAKYGFGGRKRHAKSGDALSSGDLSGFPRASAAKRSAGSARKKALRKGGGGGGGSGGGFMGGGDGFGGAGGKRGAGGGAKARAGAGGGGIGIGSGKAKKRQRLGKSRRAGKTR